MATRTAPSKSKPKSAPVEEPEEVDEELEDEELEDEDDELDDEDDEELEDDEEMGQSGNGTIFIGDKGKMMCAGWGGPPRLLPLSRMESYKRPAKKLTRSKGHHRDWLDACKGGAPASSNFEYGAKLTELVLLGAIALRSPKKIRWDSANMKFPNAPEAEKFLKESYRAGWEVI